MPTIDSVKIGAWHYQIERREPTPSEMELAGLDADDSAGVVAGLAFTASKKILLNNENELPTLIHEIFHGVATEYGLASESSENFANVGANMFVQLIVDNPELIGEILRSSLDAKELKRYLKQAGLLLDKK